MAIPSREALAPGELERGLASLDPRPVLVRPRTFRRILRRALGATGLHLPERTHLVLSREALVEVSSPSEVRREDLPDQVILLSAPARRRRRDEVLSEVWAALVRAEVEMRLRMRVGEGALGPAAVRARVDRIGQARFDEVRQVLRHEPSALPARDDVNAWIEFAALFIGLRRFAPHLVAANFPSLEDPDAVEALLAEDLPIEEIVAAARPHGADAVDRLSEVVVAAPATVERPSAARTARLARAAERAQERGNVVRCLIARLRALECASPTEREQLRGLVQRDLEALSARLAVATGVEASRWVEVLAPVLPWLAVGIRSRETRLMYDLQAVCTDHERELWTLSVVDYVRTLGELPLRRTLPARGKVRVARTLHRAEVRAAQARVADREPLLAVVHQAAHHAEREARAFLRPKLAEALDAGGLVADSALEAVARDRLVEELMDDALERGFFAFGHLRDAVSRGQLKLEDLSLPREAVFGDVLYRADRRLARPLDGVYRPAEVYLRWMQWGSTLAFGTVVGRWLSRYLALPFGGAYLVLEGLDHSIGLALHHLFHVEHHFESLANVIGLGMVLFVLLHVPPVRRAAWWGLVRFGRVARAVVWDLPRAVLALPIVRRIRASRAWKLSVDLLLRPALVTSPVAPVVATFGVPGPWVVSAGLVALGVAALGLNTRAGRLVQEDVGDGLALTWGQVSRHVLPNLFRWVMDGFRAVIDLIERMLYAVDEWLRFRQGQHPITVAFKAGLGVVWFFVTYVVRFAVNLLIEPQINPIKHFPVVTVSHKLMLPTTPLVGAALGTVLPIDPITANSMGLAMVSSVPGVFGFVAWELKENWRLYEANRPVHVRPARIGSHGETVLRLMKPGFHSGTLPKVFRKLARAQRRSPYGRRAQRYLAEVHHVEQAVRRFVDRELVAVLRRAEPDGTSLRVGRIGLASNRIVVDVERDSGRGVAISIEEQSGYLVAGIAHAGWLARVDDPARARFRAALVGLYALAGVDLVREQIAALLPAGARYDVASAGLVVWPEATFARELCYPLRPGRLRPVGSDGRPVEGPELHGDDLLLSRHPLAWADQVAVWDGRLPAGALLPDIRFLPDPISRAHRNDRRAV